MKLSYEPLGNMINESPIRNELIKAPDEHIEKYYNLLAFKFSAEDNGAAVLTPVKPNYASPVSKRTPTSDLDNQLNYAHRMNSDKMHSKLRATNSDLQRKTSGQVPLEGTKPVGPRLDSNRELRSQLSDSRRSLSNLSRRRPQVIKCFQDKPLLPCCPWLTICMVYSLGVVLLGIAVISIVLLFVLSSYVHVLLDFCDVFIEKYNNIPIQKKTFNMIKKDLAVVILRATDEIKIVLFIHTVTLVGIFVSLGCKLQIFLYLYALCQFFVGMLLFLQINKLYNFNFKYITEETLKKSLENFRLSDCKFCQNSSIVVKTPSDVIGAVMINLECCGIKDFTDFTKRVQPPKMCCTNMKPCTIDIMNHGCYDKILNLDVMAPVRKSKGYIETGRKFILVTSYLFIIVYVAISVIILINGIVFMIESITLRKSINKKISLIHSASGRSN